MKRWRCIPAVVLGLGGAVVGAGTASASPAPAFHSFGGGPYRDGGQSGHRASYGGGGGGSEGHGQPYTCASGAVPPGTYSSVVITGFCTMPAGTIVVRGDLTVAPGALLDATTPGDPAGNPLQAATVVVGGNVWVGQGAVLFLGCSPAISCPTAVNDDRVGGSITADGSLGVVVHSVTIGGSLTMNGGGNGVTGPAACATTPSLWLEDPALANGEGPGTPLPVYSDAEDDVVGGNLSIDGLTSCWLGALRNQVGGSASFSDDAMGDPDAMEMGSNLVQGNLACFDDSPAIQWGDGAAQPNLVGGRAWGECGFGVVLPNPAPEAMQGTGTPEHIAVSLWRLHRSSGTHVTTASTPMPLGTPDVTAAGDTLEAEGNTVTLAGDGLTGAVSEMVLSTVHADGSETFVAQDACGTQATATTPASGCSFDGATGAVMIVAYGTVSADGVVSGTFLVSSGGTPDGGLATLAGYGTFTSCGQPAGTLRLDEHLALT